jgi:hypothetical protein
VTEQVKRNFPKISPDDDEFGVAQKSYGWLVRRLVRIALTRWYGFVVTIFAGVGFGLAALGVYALPASRLTGRIGMLLAFGVWLCIGLLLGLVRHAIRKQPADWHTLGATARFDRILITLLGSAILGAPIAGLIWAIVAN